MKVKEFVTLITDSINPQAFPNTEFSLFSLPAFDNAETPEITLGQNIQSNKYIVPNKCILFNKLNVRFRRIWCVESDTGNKIASTEFLPLVVNEELVDYNFCYFLLLSNMVSGHLEKQTTNTSGSHKRIEPEELLNIDVNLPPIEVQHTIGSLLSSIEKRRHNNNAINAELEAMAKTIYDYWFLQFEFPDENGKPYKSSGGKMVWNEELKQNIPDGWHIKRISDIAQMQAKSITPNKNRQYQHYSIPAFDDTGMPAVEAGSSIDSNKYIVPNNAILVSKLNPQFKRIWYVGETDNDCICSTEFLPFSSIGNHKGYLYSVLNSDSFYKYMVQCSSSSTGSRKRMQPELCLEFTLVSPTDCKLVSNYCEKVEALLDRILINKKENQELASLRDFLLPLLMNGQVGFKEE